MIFGHLHKLIQDITGVPLGYKYKYSFPCILLAQEHINQLINPVPGEALTDDGNSGVEKNISRVLVRLVRSMASIIVRPLTVKVRNGGELVLPPPPPPMPLAPDEGLIT